jgi:hypothetical protein
VVGVITMLSVGETVRVEAGKELDPEQSLQFIIPGIGPPPDVLVVMIWLFSISTVFHLKAPPVEQLLQVRIPAVLPV